MCEHGKGQDGGDVQVPYGTGGACRGAIWLSRMLTCC